MPTLDWIGKKAVVNHHRQVPFHLLREVSDLSCGDSASGNLLVEGDNLLALKALLPYYGGQVKCIYIDPPYNTGNESWSYNDNVNSPEIRRWLGQVVGGQGETLDRHDRWLCMMYPRLCLLRDMLREDGAIFISIDDNEVQNLRAIMDEILGASNFVATIIWEKNYAPKASAKYLSENHEYLLVYAKNRGLWQRNLLPRTDKQDKAYKNYDNDPRGLWRPNNLAARNPYSLGTYSITCPSGRVIPGPPKGSFWRVSEAKLRAMDADNRIWWGKDGNNVPAPKIFLNEVKQGVVPMTLWPYSESGHTQDAKKELVAVLPEAEQVFNTPKPVRLIERVIHLATMPDDIVMDTFSGSATTGHAVLKMNRQDGGNRRFVLVEMDATICGNVAAERLRRVCQGYTNGKGETVAGTGGGFQYCRLGVRCFDDLGRINSEVKFADLARHVFFTETGTPLAGNARPTSPLLGIIHGRAVYLLFNGILGDRRPDGGNVLTHDVLTSLPLHAGSRVIYGEACRIGPARLARERIDFKQIPYAIRTR